MYPPSPFTCHPFFRLSLGRSMVKFTEDLYYNPDKIDKALKTMTREFIDTTINSSKMFDNDIALVVEERAGGFFYPPKVFERFWWPYTAEIVDALWSEGIVTWFHLDTSWDRNIPYFKQLPRGSAILALDGTSDIFAAKEVLRNHLCLSGDVQASLLSLGKPEEVEAYCRKLIDEVGGDGGFFLSSGCELPAAIKPENLQAMLRTGNTYELSKG
jgi:uroporphyrinogen-III decarboxylase